MVHVPDMENPVATARFAGILYLTIILLGLWSELAMLMAAGAVHLTGGRLVVLASGLPVGFAPAYAVTVPAESLFCLWLLWCGVDPSRWRARETGRKART